MKIYFVRHGESTANLFHVFSNSDSRHPLTEDGVRQARLLAGSLSAHPIERVYSSPVLRAMQTAQIIVESLSVSLETTEALREWSVGIYEGTTDPDGWELHRKVQEDWFYNHNLGSKMPGGESFLEIQARFVPFIEKLVGVRGEADREIALVAHGGLYQAMLPVVLTNIDIAFVLSHGTPYTCCIVAESRPEGLTCLSWDGTVP